MFPTKTTKTNLGGAALRFHGTHRPRSPVSRRSLGTRQATSRAKVCGLRTGGRRQEPATELSGRPRLLGVAGKTADRQKPTVPWSLRGTWGSWRFFLSSNASHMFLRNSICVLRIAERNPGFMQQDETRRKPASASPDVHPTAAFGAELEVLGHGRMRSFSAVSNVEVCHDQQIIPLEILKPAGHIQRQKLRI